MRVLPVLLVITLILGAGVAQTKQAASPVAARPLIEDGPHLFHSRDGSVLAKWVSAGKVGEKRFAPGKPIELARFSALLGKGLTLSGHTPEASTWPLPEKMLVISDVEGEYKYMLRFLKANGVVDKDGGWAFGDGHLVCVGDMVDRGSQVTETLWLMYRLAKEAKAAGGRLHYVLGNHEAMWMGGDVRYVAPKYKDTAKLFGIPCEGLVGADTELGRWMRTRNVVVRIGEFVFVHGGISPPLASRKLDYTRLNQVIRSVLGTPPSKITSQNTLGLVWGPLGPFWYRGYFKQFQLDFGPTPTVKQLDEMLENLGAKAIVVGHTKVKQVTSMFDGRVIAIDIPWTNVDNVRGILVRGKRIDVVDVEGKSNKLR